MKFRVVHRDAGTFDIDAHHVCKGYNNTWSFCTDQRHSFGGKVSCDGLVSVLPVVEPPTPETYRIRLARAHTNTHVSIGNTCKTFDDPDGDIARLTTELLNIVYGHYTVEDDAGHPDLIWTIP